MGNEDDKLPTKAKGYPRPGKCRICGAEYIKRSGSHFYCDECSAEQKRIRLKEGARKRSRQQKKPTRFLREGDKKAPVMAVPEDKERWEGHDHVCRVARRCVYGTNDGCHYWFHTEKLRSIHGEHLIQDGKCDLYQRREKRESGEQAHRVRIELGGRNVTD